MGSTGLGSILGLVVVVVAVIAAFAPLAMSVMAGSYLSAAVSVMLLIGAGASANGPTVVHTILAAVIYLAALLSASVILAGARIEAKIDALQRAAVKPMAGPPAA